MKRRLLLTALAAASLGLAACGNKEETISHGESEAEYVTLGEMQYQVQLSRQLNPADVGDRALLVGIPRPLQGLARREVWFGVWVRVTNKSGTPQRAADEFKILDTRGRVFESVPLKGANVFAYRPAIVKTVYPALNSAASSSPTGGAFLLFKLTLEALDFRPLELAFTSAGTPGEESTVRLDV